MANPIYVSYPTAGVQSAIVLDDAMAPFSVSIATFIIGSCTYGLQFTLDDVNNPNSVTGVQWFDDTALPPGTNLSGFSYYTSPIKAIRANITNVNGSLNLKILQAYGITR